MYRSVASKSERGGDREMEGETGYDKLEKLKKGQ